MVVPKKNGKFRICGDYKVTVNQVLSVEQYPLPKPEDLFATLAEASQSWICRRHMENSAQYVTVTKGYIRLPFGVASAPAIFQKMMDDLLRGIPGVICYIDDILVTGKESC